MYDKKYCYTIKCLPQDNSSAPYSDGKRYLSNRWVPHLLTAEQKSNRERICNELLQRYAANDFLGQLITMDEVWIHWDNEGSYHYKGWRGEGDMPNIEVRRY